MSQGETFFLEKQEAVCTVIQLRDWKGLEEPVQELRENSAAQEDGRLRIQKKKCFPSCRGQQNRTGPGSKTPEGWNG